MRDHKLHYEKNPCHWGYAEYYYVSELRLVECKRCLMKNNEKVIYGMTWREFVEGVEGELARKGISLDTELWYVDISFPDKGNIEQGAIDVGVDKNCGIAIG